MMNDETIHQIVTTLFPSGSNVVPEDANLDHDCKYWLIPSGDTFRWMIPQNPKYGLPVISQWRPYEIASSLKWKLLLSAYRAGGLGKLPGIKPVHISQNLSNSWEHVGLSATHNIIPVIYIGTPGPGRKAVATLLDKSTMSVSGVARIPLGEMAKDKIVHEARMLSLLGDDKPGLAPRLLYLDKRQGLSVQEAIKGANSGRKMTRAHIEWLARLKVDGEKTTLGERILKLGNELAKLDGVDNETMNMLNGVTEKLDDSSELDSYWIHGDFAPWNLRWIGNKKISAFDWENARPDGIPLYDLAHFYTIQKYLFSSKEKIGDLISLKNKYVSEYIDIVKINPELIKKIILFYFLDMWVTSVKEQNDGYAKFLLSEMKIIMRIT